MVFSILPFLCSLIAFLYVVPQTTFALQVLQPTQKGSTVIFDDTEPTTITWTRSNGDPSQFDINLCNDNTGMSPTLLEYQLQTDWSSASTYIPEVRADPYYYISCVYYEGSKQQSCGRTAQFAIYKKGTPVTSFGNPAPPKTTTTPPSTKAPPSTTQSSSPSPAPLPSDETHSNSASSTSSNPGASSGSMTGSGIPIAVTSTSNGTILVFTSTPLPTLSPTGSALDPSSSGNGTATGSTSKHSSTGAIVGGVVGGIVILVLIVVLVWLLRRRRRRMQTEYDDLGSPFTGRSEPSMTETSISPVGAFRQGSGPPTEKRRELDQIVQERQDALERRQELQGLSYAATNGSSTDHNQAELHEKIERLTNRIFELETQQRESEYYMNRGQNRLSRTVPPPDYGASTST